MKSSSSKDRARSPKEEATRPVLVPAFGAALRHARETRGLTVGQVLQKLEHHDIDIDFPRMSYLEKGAIQKPDPVLLTALAEIYGVDLGWLLALLKWNRRFERATDIPKDLSEQGGPMRVSGDEQLLVEKYRRLTERDKVETQHFMDFRLDRGAAEVAEARFPSTKRR